MWRGSLAEISSRAQRAARLRAVELRARAYRLLVRRQGERDFDFYKHELPRVRSFPEAPLKDLCVAIVTTAGLYHRTSSEPFLVAPGRGDPSFRSVPISATSSEIGITPGHFDARAAEIDLEVVFPREALQRAAEAGLVGSLCATAMSMHGHVPEPRRLAEETAPAAATILRERGARAVVVVGACALGAQSAGLVALALETAGLPATVVTQWPELAKEAGAARTTASPFPFGMTMGPPKIAPAHDWLLRRSLGRLSPRQ
jgi:D-proline reductase (dithiol) PrdB